MREMLEEEQPLFHCGKSWGDFWEDLEKLEHSLAYKDRVLMHKQVEVQGGFKNLKPPKKKGSETKESEEGGGCRRVWRRSLEMACQRRTSFRCKRNKGIYYQKFRCNQEGGGGVETGTTQEWHLLQGATRES